MDALTASVVGSLIVAAIIGIGRVAVKRHQLLIALSREVIWQREQLVLFQQVIREVALTRSFEGPMVLSGYRRQDHNRFYGLIHQALHYAPSVHASLAVFSDRVRDIETQFDEFTRILSIDPRESPLGVNGTVDYLARQALRILRMSEVVLQATDRRELVAFPLTYQTEYPSILLEQAGTVLFDQPIRLLPREGGASGPSLAPRNAVVDVSPLNAEAR